MRKIKDIIMQWIMALIVALTFGVIGCGETQNHVQTSPPDNFAIQPKQEYQPQPRDEIVTSEETVRPLDDNYEHLGIITPVDRPEKQICALPLPPAPVIKSTKRPASQTLSEALENKSSAPQQRVYTMQDGDTLWSIARQHYGNGNKWRKIANANPSIDINKIKVGQMIVLPY